MNKQDQDELIEERGSTHGDYKFNIAASKKISDVLLDEYQRYCWCYGKKPNYTAQGALMAMGIKISRMIHGDTLYDDHLDDFSTYLRFFAETKDEGNKYE